jgi:predicted nucleotidyltransferase
MKREFEAGRAPVFTDDFGDILLSSVRRMTNEEIRRLPYVSEGLENRIKESAGISGSLPELIENICTRRYPRTRVMRVLFHILTGLTGSELDNFNGAGGPRYIRVLGFNDNGRRILASMKKRASLPVITKTANFKNSNDSLLNRMLKIESDSTDMYVLGCSDTKSRFSGQEFTNNPVIENGEDHST